MAKVSRCDKCGSMANATVKGIRMVVLCPHCRYKVIKRVSRRRSGG